MLQRMIVSIVAILFAGRLIGAQVASERLLDTSARESQNWLTYSGSYSGQRYSLLNQIDLANAKDLEVKWIYQTYSTAAFETTPLVVDGVMYLTQGPNDVVALDALSGRPFWIYRYTPIGPVKGFNANRGLAISGDTLFMGTTDDYLIAIDAVSGRPVWKTKVAEREEGYSITHAPLVIKDKVLIGTAGGEYPTRCFLAAYDVRTGHEVWRFYSTPAPGEPGNESWPGDTWKRGGGSVWITGSYDPALNLTFWGIGNPNPDLNPEVRRGDNLYTDSVIALDPDIGKLKWHFQFTPNEQYDYDAVQVPVLADMLWQGAPRKVMLWANRNGFFYVLDRETGAFLKGTPFVKVNWASGLDAHGRPLLTLPTGATPLYPGPAGGTSWYSPTYSPRTELFYVTSWEDSGMVIRQDPQECKLGESCWNGSLESPIPFVPRPAPGANVRAPYLTAGQEANGTGAVIAIDPRSGMAKWKFPLTNLSTSGLLTTAADVLFTGSREGYFQALDARTGTLLWKVNLGGQVNAGPITYATNGKQYVAIAAGTAMFAIGLRESPVQQ